MKNNKWFKFIPSKIAFRLWGIMMGIVLMCTLFIWLVQVPLFEQNYITETVKKVESQLTPITEELKTTDLSTNANLLPYLSKIINGKAILVNDQGNLIQAYAYGMPIEQQFNNFIIDTYITNSPCYSSALDGTQKNMIVGQGTPFVMFQIGIPVTYENHKAVVILCNPLPEIYTVKDINQKQLILLSIILVLAGSIIAWLLSHRFTKPIHTIKDTVDRLASGELSAVPGLKLKDELGQLSSSVEELGKTLQRIDVLRKEVIANVSHELRAPLALIVGYSEMVRDISWNDDAARNENMDLIIRESQRLSRMVDDIMDYSQFQAGFINLNKDEYNLSEIVETEIETSKKMAADYNIKFELDGFENEISVHVDALKISQVMRNLLNNAINHTADGETIIISALQTDKLRVMVSNPGKPIPLEKIDMIWERYYSSQHHGTRRQGTGIGLSIVKTILNAHGFPYGVFYEDGYNKFWFEIV